MFELGNDKVTFVISGGGENVGEDVGLDVGWVVGKNDGCTVGMDVGKNDGCTVGMDDGILVVLIEVRAVYGTAVGFPGKGVGKDVVGLKVGTPDGIILGK